MPFDFTTILGCSTRDTRLRELLEFCEEAPRLTDREPELGDRYYIEFPGSGFSLLLTGADIVGAIHIYAHPNGEYHAFLDELPFGIAPNTTQAEAHVLFGPPTRTGGPIVPIIPSKPVVYWDRWDYERYSIHLEYSELRDSVLLITIASISKTSPESSSKRL